MTPEQLANIQARVDAAEAKRAQSRRNPGPIFDAAMMLAIQASSADVPALLALVRSQQAQIERVEALADEVGSAGYVTARRVRAALTATEGA